MQGIVIKKIFPFSAPSDKMLALALAGIIGLVLLVQVVKSSNVVSATSSVVTTGSPSVVYLSPKGEAARAVASETKASMVPMLEVHVANNGLVLLRGAHVVSVSGSILSVSTGWGSADFAWKVETANYVTSFVQHDGQKGTLLDIHPGDFVTITGMLNTETSVPTIEARTIRS